MDNDETRPDEGSAPETVAEPEPRPALGPMISSYTGGITIRHRADGLPHEGYDPGAEELAQVLEKAIGGTWDVVANVSLTRSDR